MDIMYPRCAGLDVHKDSVVACVRVAHGASAKRETRTFGTTTGALFELGAWLETCGVTHVAMEATGVYWKPVWHVLEDHPIKLFLANAAHIKNLPGRKTDVSDANWIADLLAHGLVPPSFVPPTEIQDLRILTRSRKQLRREQSRQLQRVQQVLEDANIKLGSVVSDITGRSARAILNAICAGESDPDELVALVTTRLKASRASIREALRGKVRDIHRTMLKVHLDQIDAIEKAIARLDAEIERALAPFREDADRLMNVPGLGRNAVAVVIAEIGVDMKHFPSADHLVSWARMCPGNDESAGRKRSSRTGKGPHWLKETLVQAAWSAMKVRGSHLAAVFYRVRARSGGKKAAVAVGAEILRAIYHMLARKEAYVDHVPRPTNARDRLKQVEALQRKIIALGFDVEVHAKEAA